MMPKQLINIIGIIVAVGILVFAVAIGVYPQIAAAVSTTSQADQVAATNSAYQTRIDQLEQQKKNLPEIQATVAKLHQQIPAEYRLDDVFLLVAKSADAANATITSVTADSPTAFAERTAPVPEGQPTPAPSATPQSNPSPSPSASTAATATGTNSEGVVQSGDGRTQIPITISVTVTDTESAAKFLDALRNGPRLLANVTSSATAGGAEVTLQVSALAFAEPSTATIAKGGN